MRAILDRLRTDPFLAITLAWIAFVAVIFSLPAQAAVDACSFRIAPPDRSMKGPLYQAPDRFTPDQRKTI